MAVFRQGGGRIPHEAADVINVATASDVARNYRPYSRSPRTRGPMRAITWKQRQGDHQARQVAQYRTSSFIRSNIDVSQRNFGNRRKWSRPSAKIRDGRSRRAITGHTCSGREGQP